LPKPVIRCYQSLSLTICKALLKEETNSEYLTNQSKILNDFIDDHQNIDSSKPFFYNLKTFLMKVYKDKKHVNRRGQSRDAFRESFREK
jgi:hypothetical protein